MHFEAGSCAIQVFSDEKGVYVKFESKGDANAVDSPATLYFTVRRIYCDAHPTRTAYFSTMIIILLHEICDRDLLRVH